MKNNSKTLRNLIMIGVYIAVIVSAVILGVTPKLTQLSTNQKDLQKAKQDLADTQDKRSSLEALNKDKTRIDTINAVTLSYIPENSNNSDFVVKTEALAKELSIIISSFSFTEVKVETAKKTDTSEETASTTKKTETATTDSKTTKKVAPQNSSEFTIIFTGEYGQIQMFLEKMESFPRLNIVDSINISGYNKEKNAMTLKIVGRIFYGN